MACPEYETEERGDEASFVARLREREPGAWAELYDAHYLRIYRYCYARTTNAEVAADLASRVFLAALEGIEGFTYQGRPILSWLYRIARNLCATHLRSAEREHRALERAGSMREETTGSPATLVADRQDIAQALSLLTDEQRQVVTLRYFGELTTAEIANEMRKSERAVYSLEVRALASLRRILEPGASSPAAQEP